MIAAVFCGYSVSHDGYYARRDRRAWRGPVHAPPVTFDALPVVLRIRLEAPATCGKRITFAPALNMSDDLRVALLPMPCNSRRL